MPRVKLKVRGTRGAVRAFQRLGKEARERMKGVIREVSEDIRAGAEQAAPVETGKLRRSMRVFINRTGLAAEIGSDLFYASFVELGTKQARRQEFLRPAFAENRPRVTTEVQEAVRRAASAAKQSGAGIS